MSAAPPALRLLLRSLSEAAAMRYSYPDSSLFESALSMAKTIAAEVIPTPLHVLDRISPILSPFSPVFCALSPSRRGGSNKPQAGAQG